MPLHTMVEPSHDHPSLQGIRFDDDFDEYRARASSGGSLYGLLRRQAFARRSVKRSPEERHCVRQRSRSLIPKSVALPEEKSILKLLCEYTETARREADLEQRRHSTACVLAFNKRRSPSPSPCRGRPGSRHASSGDSAGPASPAKSGSGGVSTASATTASCSNINLVDDAAVGSASLLTTPVPPAAASRNELTVPSAEPSTSAVAGTSSSSSNEKTVAFQLDTSPSSSNLLLPPGQGDAPPTPNSPTSPFPPGAIPPICRRRSFTVTPKGLVNEGDDVVAINMAASQTTSSLTTQTHFGGSTGSDIQLLGTDRQRTGSFNSLGSGYSGDSSENTVFRIMMCGGPGVGKTALTQQFLTSEYMAAQNTSFDDGVEWTVPVLLDGEETIMEVLDLPYTGDPRTWKEYDVDGYVIIYSITNRRSFRKALDLLHDIRKDDEHTSLMLILVANKSDLVRSRMVAEQEGKTAAQSYDCKYIEVSAILNHKVDHLLVGIVKQIRAQPEKARDRDRKPKAKRPPARMNSGDVSCVSLCSKTNGIMRLFGSNKFISRSCENLLTL